MVVLFCILDVEKAIAKVKEETSKTSEEIGKVGER